MTTGAMIAEAAVLAGDAAIDAHIARQVFQRWLIAFEAALSSGDLEQLKPLFLVESYWRDQIGLTWDMQQFWGCDALCDRLLEGAKEMRPSGFRIAPERAEPRLVIYNGAEYIEGFCQFELPHGIGQAMIRLRAAAESPAGALAFSLGTDLHSVSGVVERKTIKVTPDNMEPVQPIHGFDPAYPGQTWPEHLAENAAYEERDPDVLILGGGHTGIMVGARLHQMGLSYLIVDRGERPGDSWRARYESLALHTVGSTNQLPYIRTPDIFPDYIPKDRWADWIESYRKLMGLNYWSSTEFISGAFDEADGLWRCELKLADGASRTMRPRHIVLALGGVGSDPIVPNLPGLDDFAGTMVHSKYFKTGRDYRGQRVLVVGTSTSGHDIAFDLYNKGAQVTMAQRSPTMIARLVEGVRHNENYVSGKMSVDEADQRRGANGIYPLRTEYLRRITIENNKQNAELRAALERAGLRLTDGPDGTGWLGKLAREFKGFYINMGCADVIASGDIKVIQMDDFDRFVAEGVRMRDGSIIPFDAIVLATGFINQNQELTGMFGEEIARRVGPCAGLDETGEQYGNSKPLHQRQLWQIYGGINDSRRLSKVLALQLAAQLKGFVPPLERMENGRLRRIAPTADPSI